MKISLKVYKAKCIDPIAIHGIGDCLVGMEYELNEDQLKYNGGAFDVKNAKFVKTLIIDDEIGEHNGPILTKQELVEKEMEDNNAVALAKEREAADKQGMSLEEYRAWVKGARKPAAEVAQSREARGKELSKKVKLDLVEIAVVHALEVADSDTREVLIGKILDKEFSIIPVGEQDSRPAGNV